jgi:hypothetical protein
MSPGVLGEERTGQLSARAEEMHVERQRAAERERRRLAGGIIAIVAKACKSAIEFFGSL